MLQLRISGIDAGHVAGELVKASQAHAQPALLCLERRDPQVHTGEVYRGALDPNTAVAILAIVTNLMVLYDSSPGLAARAKAKDAWQRLIDAARALRKEHPDAEFVLEEDNAAPIVLDQADANKLVDLSLQVERFRRQDPGPDGSG